MNSDSSTLALIAAALAFAIPGIGRAQAADTSPLFADDRPLALTIEGPFRRLDRDGNRRPERPGVVRFVDASGSDVVLDVELRVRGNSRLAICSFPPLRLDFERGQVEGTVFEGQNRLKLVTLCQRTDRYRDYLKLEYQIYRMFSALTDYSFRVRWATVEYLESDPKRKSSFTEPAFFIEEDWEVAARHGLEVVETDRLEVTDLEPRQTALLGLFQYVIGNTDWSVLEGPGEDACCHNGKVIGSTGGGAFIIPYDFDQAGLIDAAYALPSEKLPIRSVTQRLYRGFCAMNAELQWALGRFNEERGTMEEMLRSDAVGERARNRSLEFLAESYEILNDPEAFKDDIVDVCRGRR